MIIVPHGCSCFLKQLRHEAVRLFSLNFLLDSRFIIIYNISFKLISFFWRGKNKAGIKQSEFKFNFLLSLGIRKPVYSIWGMTMRRTFIFCCKPDLLNNIFIIYSVYPLSLNQLIPSVVWLQIQWFATLLST